MQKILLVLFLYLSSYAGSYPSLLFHGNCIACHDINSSKSAPNIQTVKDAYLQAFPKRNEFVNQMSVWVFNPKEETSIMQQEIEKFELMPNLAYDIEVLKEIAAYIYDTDFK